MSWFRRESGGVDVSGAKKSKSQGLWVKCEQCQKILWREDLEASLQVCTHCGKHFRVNARTRLRQLFDDGQYEVFDSNLRSTDPLEFSDLEPYRERLKKAQQETGLADAVINGEGRLQGRTVIIVALEYAFIGGSLGAAMGESITRAIERALAKNMPLIVVSASGGARMMEGCVSLMQLAKIAAALAKLDAARVPYISVLTDPTTGGVTASFAMLGDLNIAEPGALIGFAGPRVIEQTIRQKLPEGFQRGEFLLQKGMLDAVVDRRKLKAYLSRTLDFLAAS
jgi:acetyl-CoA carboxylase carboxyl transferase subunit beta